MEQGYTPRLLSTAKTHLVKTRELPIPGHVLVSPGDLVTADTPVLSAELPGDIHVIQIADQLGFEPERITKAVKLKPGDIVQKGQILCELQAFFGLLRSKLESPVAGTVEFFTESNAHLGIRGESTPLVVNAYISGRVNEIEAGKAVNIETTAAVVQGVFGVGGERQGKIFVLPLSANSTVEQSAIAALGASIEDAVLVGGAQYTIDALNQAAKQKAKAVVCGSIAPQVLREFTHKTSCSSVTGDENIPLTIVVTEGFGFLPIAERILAWAAPLQGENASVNGATQVRAGALRPEVIVPVSPGKCLELTASGDKQTSGLAIGERIRIIRVPYFGQCGVISALPTEPRKIESGAFVRILEAKLDNGTQVIVPRANVELI